MVWTLWWAKLGTSVINWPVNRLIVFLQVVIHALDAGTSSRLASLPPAFFSRSLLITRKRCGGGTRLQRSTTRSSLVPVSGGFRDIQSKPDGFLTQLYSQIGQIVILEKSVSGQVFGRCLFLPWERPRILSYFLHSLRRALYSHTYCSDMWVYPYDRIAATGLTVVFFAGFRCSATWGMILINDEDGYTEYSVSTESWKQEIWRWPALEGV